MYNVHTYMYIHIRIYMHTYMIYVCILYICVHVYLHIPAYIHTSEKERKKERYIVRPKTGHETLGVEQNRYVFTQ